MEESETPKRFDTRSKITIRAQADDNDADYTCEARHPALIAPKRASITLNVLCKYLLPLYSSIMELSLKNDFHRHATTRHSVDQLLMYTKVVNVDISMCHTLSVERVLPSYCCCCCCCCLPLLFTLPSSALNSNPNSNNQSVISNGFNFSSALDFSNQSV